LYAKKKIKANMPGPVICIGASFVDELFHITGEFLPATTNTAELKRSPGGVSRNIAHQLARLAIPVQLVSVFGNDPDANWLIDSCRIAGINLDLSIFTNYLSGRYTGILNSDGSLMAAFISNVLEHHITPAYLNSIASQLRQASFILADLNTPVDGVEWLIAFCRINNVRLIIERVSVPPAKRLRNASMDGVWLITPNEDELPALCVSDGLAEKANVQELIQRNVQSVWVHKGKSGSVLYSKDKILSLEAPLIQMADSTGAGDAALSGYIFGKWLNKSDEECLKLAHSLAAEVLQVHGAVADHIDPPSLLSFVTKYYPA
jgi:pseudouridine kinase